MSHAAPSSSLPMSDNNPILNNPYEEPRQHYATNLEGELDYARPMPGRRIFTPDIQTIPLPQQAQRDLLELNEVAAADHGNHLVNLLRREIAAWRAAQYPQTTRITRELLQFWFLNDERDFTQGLFFAQREAIETAIWLNEVAEKSNVGQHILRRLETEWRQVSDDALPRIALKMATGTGKTVVMAALIAYHYFNRLEYRNDTRFADNFLVITPGITIRDRLGVLRVDTRTGAEAEDYYYARYLVPKAWREKNLAPLNSKIVITNYHTFEPRTLQGNKRSPFDGKIGADGKKQEATEDPAQVIAHVLSHFKAGSRLLVINDEAHHCYLPRQDDRTAEAEPTKDENVRAAVWFNALVRLADRFKLRSIYDLSATPYYLTGSGYDPYTLFPWVVSDFGLIESIESGLVKIPFLPQWDDTPELDMPVLRNLYSTSKKSFPRPASAVCAPAPGNPAKNSAKLRPSCPTPSKPPSSSFTSITRRTSAAANTPSVPRAAPSLRWRTSRPFSSSSATTRPFRAKCSNTSPATSNRRMIKTPRPRWSPGSSTCSPTTTPPRSARARARRAF